MKIEKVNEFWVPSNDIHLDDWKAGKAFTQNKCLLNFLEYCELNKKTFNHVLDIGAWVGTWAMSMNKFCKKITAFEPDSLHFECLNKNVGDNINTQQLAIGNDTKMISLNNDDFTQARRVIGEGDIQMVAIDSFEFTDVDLIKIDVEGYEMEVLKGAKQTISTCKYLMIELNNNTKKYGSNNLEIENYLNNSGFKLLMDHWPDKIFQNAN